MEENSSYPGGGSEKRRFRAKKGKGGKGKGHQRPRWKAHMQSFVLRTYIVGGLGVKKLP